MLCMVGGGAWRRSATWQTRTSVVWATACQLQGHAVVSVMACWQPCFWKYCLCTVWACVTRASEWTDVTDACTGYVMLVILLEWRQLLYLASTIACRLQGVCCGFCFSVLAAVSWKYCLCTMLACVARASEWTVQRMPEKIS